MTGSPEEQALRAALHTRPHDPALWSDLGRLLRRRGDTGEAIACYRRAAAGPEAPAAALFNLGNALHANGAFAEAEAAFLTALERDPSLTAAALQAARCAVALNQAEVARARFADVLRREPGNFSAWLELGHLLRRQGAVAAMRDAYDRAVAVAPDRWEGHLALARACEEVGETSLAAAAYHRATLMAGVGTAALRRIHRHMAVDRLERGQVPSALEAIRQAVMTAQTEHPAPEPDTLAELQIDLCAILARLTMTAEARTAFERAATATGQAVLLRLAELALSLNLWREALEILRRNVALRPDSADAHHSLAHGLSRSWMFEDALASLARAEALASDRDTTEMHASIAAHLGDPDRAYELYRTLAEAKGSTSWFRSNAAMCTLYSDRLVPSEVATIHRALFAGLGHDARPRTSFGNTLDPDRRLRIGFVTPDLFRQHPVGIFLQPVLSRLQASDLAITIYATGAVQDAQTERVRTQVQGWVEAAGWSDARLAQCIATDAIDVLVDLSGHTSGNRMALFARRAAPVQMSFLGYPGSTGVPNMDWILGDPIVTPEGCVALYSERVMRLPHTVFCFAPDADYPEPAFDGDGLDRPLTFGSFNTVTKLTPRTIALWTQVLAAVPDARLLLKAPSFNDPGAIRAFQERFAAAGLSPERLELRGPSGLEAMMAEYAEVDIGLDPVPYNGGTTTLQAMWMGVPVICGLGGHFVSRMSASFMTAAGLPEWVATDDAAYVATARAMAADRVALRQLKRGLRTRLRQAPAWDVADYARDLAGALRSAWREWCAEAGQRSAGAAVGKDETR